MDRKIKTEMTADYTLETMQWEDRAATSLKYWEQKPWQPRILYLAKMSFKNNKIKISGYKIWKNP